MNITDARGEKCRQSSCSSGENLSAPFAHKAGLHKNFVKGMDKTNRGFKYVRNKFPNVTKNQGRCIYRTPDQQTDARQTVR